MTANALELIISLLAVSVLHGNSCSAIRAVHRAARLFLLLVTSTMAIAATAAAESDSNSHRLDVGLYGGVAESPGVFASFGYVFSAGGHYALTPNLRIGGSLDWVSMSSTSGDTVDEAYTSGFEVFRQNARAELHALPSFYVDPWCAFALGVFEGGTTGLGEHPQGIGMDIEADAGLDFHVGHVTVGPSFRFVEPVAHRSLVASSWYYAPVGLRVLASF